MSWLWVAFGGAVGASARYGISVLLPTSSFPWPTLVANLLGCCAIGWLVGHYTQAEWFLGAGRLFLVTGLLGGFTTFSAFSLETVQLAQAGQLTTAAVYVLISLATCLAGAWFGLQLGSG